MVVEVFHIVFRAVVCEVKIICLCRVFGCECVNLLDNGSDTVFLPQITHHERITVAVQLFFAYFSCNLEVAETLLLGSAEEGEGNIFYFRAVCEFCGSVYDVFQFVEKPTVDFRKFMDFLHAVALNHSLRDDENSFVRRVRKCLVYVCNLDFAVTHEAVHALSYHSQTFLDCFLKGAADSHNFAHGFHGTTYFAAHTVEFAKVPTWYFAHDIVQRRFKKG